MLQCITSLSIEGAVIELPQFALPGRSATKRREGHPDDGRSTSDHLARMPTRVLSASHRASG